MDVHIRLASVEDVKALHQIELHSFTLPWSEEALHNELSKNRFAHYTIIEYEGEIVGYCGVWIIVDEAHITNIAILPEYRGKGLGEKLLWAVMQLARQSGALTMTLEVRLSNEPARFLYEKLGFEPGGVRKNYYADNQEDALVMWVKL